MVFNGDLPTEDFHLISLCPCRAHQGQSQELAGARHVLLALDLLQCIYSEIIMNIKKLSMVFSLFLFACGNEVEVELDTKAVWNQSNWDEAKWQ